MRGLLWLSTSALKMFAESPSNFARACSRECGPEALAVEPNLPPWTPVFEVTVRPGQVLSRICEDFYGTGRPPLPALVARYNGLADEHSLRAGQNLQLPPRERLDEP